MSNEYPPQPEEVAAAEQQAQLSVEQQLAAFNTAASDRYVPTPAELDTIGALVNQVTQRPDGRYVDPTGNEVDPMVVEDVRHQVNPAMWVYDSEKRPKVQKAIDTTEFTDLSPKLQAALRQTATEQGLNPNKAADLAKVMKQTQDYLKSRLALSDVLSGMQEETVVDRNADEAKDAEVAPDTDARDVQDEQTPSPQHPTPPSQPKTDVDPTAGRRARRDRKNQDSDTATPTVDTDSNDDSDVSPQPVDQAVLDSVRRNQEQRARQRAADEKRRRDLRTEAEEAARNTLPDDEVSDDSGSDSTSDDDGRYPNDFDDEPIYVRDRSGDRADYYNDDDLDDESPEEREQRLRDEYIGEPRDRNFDYVDDDDFDDEDRGPGRRDGRNSRGNRGEDLDYTPDRDVLAGRLALIQDVIREMARYGSPPEAMVRVRRLMTQEAYREARIETRYRGEEAMRDADLMDDQPDDDDLSDRLRRIRRRTLESEGRTDGYDPDGVYEVDAEGDDDDLSDRLRRIRGEYTPLSEQTPLTREQLRQIRREESRRNEPRPTSAERRAAFLQRMARARDALRATTDVVAEQAGFVDREEMRRAFAARLMGGLASLRELGEDIWDARHSSASRRRR